MVGYNRSVRQSPYRAPLPTRPCPRCGGRLIELAVAGAEVADCSQCGGIFVPADVLHDLGRPEAHDLRASFPKRARTSEGPVRYLKCPVCERLMNRFDFARVSKVIVDVCKDDGTWFDVGELDLVLAFIERGGLAASNQRQAEERAKQNERLREAWRQEHEAAEAAAARIRGKRQLSLSPGERRLLEVLFGRWT